MQITDADEDISEIHNDSNRPYGILVRPFGPVLLKEVVEEAIYRHSLEAGENDREKGCVLVRSVQKLPMISTIRIPLRLRIFAGAGHVHVRAICAGILMMQRKASCGHGTSPVNSSFPE